MKDMWKKIKRGVYITLGSIGLIIGAIFSVQPPTLPVPIPVVQTAERRWVATNDYTTSITVSGITYEITLRKGFETDYASIPVKVQSDSLLGMSNSTPCLRRGSYVHDGLCSLTDANGGGGPVSLHVANLIFRQAIREDGCIKAKEDVIFAMVEAWVPFAVMHHTPESVVKAQSLVTVVKK